MGLTAALIFLISTLCLIDLASRIGSSILLIFLDLKYHDIPSTVANACRADVDLGVWMLNIHAVGGKKMMEAAYESLEKSGSSKNRPLLIAVTLLTSISSNDFFDGIQLEIIIAVINKR